MTETPGGPPRLRSPLARAVVPVAGGIAVLAMIMLATWAIAAFVARGGTSSTERLVPSQLEVGGVENVAADVDENGPILLAGLNTSTGERSIVLDHEGDDPTEGWQVYLAHPDGEPGCPIVQDQDTGAFTDCVGAPIEVDRLARPTDINPLVENQETLYIDLRRAGTTPTTSG